MKQLNLFFPHLFPSYWVLPGIPEGLLEKLACQQESLSKAKSEIAEAKSEITNMRLTLLEQKQELLYESFDKALEILSTPRSK